MEQWGSPADDLGRRLGYFQSRMDGYAPMYALEGFCLYGLIGAHVVLGLTAWGEGAEDQDGYRVPKAARMHFYKALLLLSSEPLQLTPFRCF